MKKNNYEIIVGNIGTVYTVHNYKSAYKDFVEYRELSKAGYGRIGGEHVIMTKNGDTVHEYWPEIAD